jgi:hypothetical protein
MLPVGKDTLLRVVRRQAPAEAGPIRTLGIDEWAWRRRQRYGTILCGLEKRRCTATIRMVERVNQDERRRGQPEVGRSPAVS